MDPEDIERISHPSSDQVYTVVSRAAKPNDQLPRPLMKNHSTSTPDVAERPGSSNSDRRQDGSVSKYPSASNVSAAKGRPHGAGGGPPVACPRYPPPPPPNKKPPHQSRQPLNYNNNDEHDYSDPADELSSPSPEPLSPVHQFSPTNAAHSHSKMPVPSQRSKEDLFSGAARGGGREQSKPKPLTKPVPRKKPMGLVMMGRPEAQPCVRAFSPPRERPPSPFRSPLLPPTSPKQKPQQSPSSPESPKQQQPPHPSMSAPNAKPRHRPSYAEIDPDQEIKVEPITPRLSATDNDMWVKVKYSSRHFHQDSLGRRSSSSSNLTNTMNSASGSENYSNLAELTIDLPVASGSTSGSSSQRRHSFTGGDENMLVIKASAANR